MSGGEAGAAVRERAQPQPRARPPYHRDEGDGDGKGSPGSNLPVHPGYFIHISVRVVGLASWLLVGRCTAVFAGCCNAHNTHSDWSKRCLKCRAVIGPDFHSLLLLVV